MPEIARILPFPTRETSRRSLAPWEALSVAREYWSLAPEVRTEELRGRTLSNPDVLVSVFGLLRDEREKRPKLVADEASAIHVWLKNAETTCGVFDEKWYFLAESAFLAGISYRFLGQREEATRWLDRAEANFRHTLNPAPGLANVAYARLALRYEMGHFEYVLEFAPPLRASFERLAMDAETAKCRLLEAMTLKESGRLQEALGLLEPVRTWEERRLEAPLKARIVSELGDLYQLDDRFNLAMDAYRYALTLLQKDGPSLALADLKMFVGEAHRQRDLHAIALEAFQAAAADYEELGFATRLAYLRIFIAETLLRLNRNREAEWQILAALPTIEEQRMVPEGFSAIALLKESVRRRKTDPNALRELREQLQSTA
jgi:tetratricopeptide (TPR) repeat protein